MIAKKEDLDWWWNNCSISTKRKIQKMWVGNLPPLEAPPKYRS